MSYRIKTVATMTGIPRGTLLAWERRHNILDPDRSSGGYRMYTDADVALLRRLKDLVDQGYTIGEAVLMVRPEATAKPASDLASELRIALLNSDREAVAAIAPRLAHLSFARAIDEVYMPVLREVGAMWARGEISVAQEHFASGFCREQMIAVFHGLGGGPAGGRSVACATAPGEHHEIALLAIATRLALDGFAVAWLGADLPVDDLCAYVRDHRPEILCLSYMVAPNPDAVRDYAERVRAGVPSETRVVIGGPAVAGLLSSEERRLWFCQSYDELKSVLASPLRRRMPSSELLPS